MIYLNCLIHNKECTVNSSRGFSKSFYLYCKECYKLYTMAQPLVDWFHSGSKNKKIDKGLKDLAKSGNFKYYNYLVNTHIYDYFTYFTYVDNFLTMIQINKYLAFPLTKNFAFNTALSINSMKKNNKIYINSNNLPISMINSKQFLSNLLNENYI